MVSFIVQIVCGHSQEACLMLIMSPPPWGTSRFTVVSHHPNVCQRPLASVSLPDFVYAIFPSFSPMTFKFTDSDHGQDLALINFS